MQLSLDTIETRLSGYPIDYSKFAFMKLLHPIVMKVAYSSVNLVSFLQLKYVLAVAFLATVAFCSDEFERSSRQLTVSVRKDLLANLSISTDLLLHSGGKGKEDTSRLCRSLPAWFGLDRSCNTSSLS